MMTARRKRFNFWGTFGSYSILLHLTGFLAIFIFIGTPTSNKTLPTFDPPILIRLIDPHQVIPKAQPLPTTTTSQAKALPPPPKPKTILIQNSENLFHVLSHTNVFPTPSRKDSPDTSKPTYPFTPITFNTFPTPDFGKTLPDNKEPPNLTGIDTRTFSDQRADRSNVNSTPAKILYSPTPLYPKIARELGLEGKTILRVEILKDGQPGMIEIQESCGHTVLDEAAAQAVKKWKFSPAQDGLFPIRSMIDLPIRFTIKS